MVHCAANGRSSSRNFEQTRRNYSAVLTIAPSAVTSINNRLRAVNYPGQLMSTGVVPASFDTTNFFTRIDHRINQRNQLSARYSLYHINAVNSRTVGGLNAVSRGTGLKDTDQTVQVSNVTTFSSRTLNEARFQYTNSRSMRRSTTTVGPAVNIAVLQTSAPRRSRRSGATSISSKRSTTSRRSAEIIR